MNRPIYYLLMVLLSILPAASAQDDIETQALKLEQQLMAPCCYGGTVAGHDSGIVRQIRTDIRKRLQQGMTPQQIQDAYVAQFGERVLAAPPTRGFHVMAYVLPPLLMAVGLAALILFLRRFKENKEPIHAQTEVDSDMVARIERELKSSG